MRQWVVSMKLVAASSSGILAPTRSRGAACAPANIGPCQAFAHQDRTHVEPLDRQPRAEPAIVARGCALGARAASARYARQDVVTIAQQFAKPERRRLAERAFALAPCIRSGFGSVKADEPIDVATTTYGIAVDNLNCGRIAGLPRAWCRIQLRSR